MNNVKIPKILKQFSKDLLNNQREYISIEAIPLKEKLNEDPLKITDSKLLGLPFIPEDMAYPLDKNGKPLNLIAQINFAQVPVLDGFPSEGILQLYFNTSEWWGAEGSEKIIYLNSSDLKKVPRTDFSFIAKESYEELPVWKIHQLQFKKSIDTGNSEDCQFSVSFGDKTYWEFEEELSIKDKNSFNEYFSCDGHKIGGYGYFMQGDPRDYDENQANDIQLLQLDTDDEIMFGDSGIGHIFISPENLAKKEFEKAYFYWDCC